MPIAILAILAVVLADLIFGIPVMVLPLVLLWKAPGENRSRLALAAELVMVYIPLTAGSQLTYELPFLIGHPFNLLATHNRSRLAMALVAVRAGRHPLPQRRRVHLRPRVRRRSRRRSAVLGLATDAASGSSR